MLLRWELRVEAAGKAEDVEDGKVESQLKVGLKEVRPKMPPETPTWMSGWKLGSKVNGSMSYN